MLFSSRWSRLLAVAVIAAALSPVAGSRGTTEGRAIDNPFPKRIRIPALPEGLQWLNTSGPLELDDFRGKFVLLDFWTYCCINCMHILPELAKLEEAYPNELVVVGVHSAKFETERDAKNIAEAISRYDIRHPVINDANHAVWEQFGVDSWPTLLLIDPEGSLVWGTRGETTFEKLQAVIKPGILYYREKGLLDETPLRFDLEQYGAEPTPLRFPGKILADAKNDRLFIADSSHHRIVVTRLDGTLLAVIGAGRPGRANGDFTAAEFNDPQGMALQGNALYVADNRNHMIRRVDLSAQKVTTTAGTGKQRREAPSPRMSDARSTAIASPWDLLIHDGYLYVAMAGPHQIWRMKLGGSTIGPYAGNGFEDIVDGPLLGRAPYQTGYASFAQPSGLATDGTWLYVADSEGSSIRAVPLGGQGEVKTVVGTAQLPMARLFTFGDVDGPREKVRLQHPLGVAFHDSWLYVADTYNNKIKTIDSAGQTQTLVGTGEAGDSDNPPRFDEPAGIAAAAGKLYVADTNNHRIRVVHLDDGNRVTTLNIVGLKPPAATAESPTAFSFPGAAQEKVEPVNVAPQNGQIRLRVQLELPAGHKFNADAPTAVQIQPDAAATAAGIVPPERGKRVRVANPAGPIDIVLAARSGQGRGNIRVGLDYYYCREGAEALCKRGSVVWTIPIEVSAGGASQPIVLRHNAR
jgi:thiol-disulfide isomerase/thioredoxin/sugar lactone lactonase YvrE